MTIYHSEIPTFDLIEESLTGSHLLEASAGTGKTYSLSFIYLRLILEQQCRVEEIVVATFTNAATAELKERIYAQLLAAEQCLLALIQGNNIDASENNLVKLLKQLRHKISDDTLTKRLRLAQVQFDRAQIYSLDGFATHLLQEHAITLGHSFPESIETNHSEMVKTCYLELAHNNFSALGQWADPLGQAVKSLSSEKLFELLTQMLTHRNALEKTVAQVTIDETVEQHFETTVESIFAHNEAFSIIIDIISEACEKKYLNAKSYKIDNLVEKRKELEQRHHYQPEQLKWFEYFSRSKLCNSLNKSHQDKTNLFDHPLFGFFDTLATLSPILKNNTNHRHFLALMQLVRTLQEQLSQYKAEQMLMTHSDIMQVVSDGASKLVDKTTYRAVLLDEAQDTNAEQLALFQQLFLDCDRICFFVGDPKQAIYGFRGGNVYTYLDIKNQVKHHYRLPNNFRSSKIFNDSINTLFSNNPFTQGIDYHAVGCAKENPQSTVEQTALTLLTADSKSPVALADVAAEAIITLLNEKPDIYDKSQDTIRPLQSKDIAVLVRGHNQAEMIKSALSKRQLSASYLGKKSVYESDEALLIHCLLSAISTGKPRTIRALMLSAFFNETSENLLDDNLINQRRTELRGFASQYSPQRFATIFYAVMQRYQIPGQLLRQNDGKRRLSNVIQIFELLQHALQRQALSLQGLADFLMRQIQSHDKETELRLEDETAVSIMTIHQSKGLEFPVVCLPFINYRATPRIMPDNLLYSHQKDQAMLANLNFPELKKACQDEENAEEIRLAYVALTRAIYRNIVVLQPQPKNTNATRSNSSWQKITEELSPTISEYSFTKTSNDLASSVTAYSSPDADSHTIKTLPSPLSPLWIMTSFSGLQQQSDKTHQHATPTIAENLNTQTNADLTVIPHRSMLLDFVAGAKAGTLLHSLYEHYMQHRLLDEDFINQAKHLLDNHYPKRFQLADAQALAAAIAETATIALYPKHFCLNDINPQQQDIEMQFFLHLSPDNRRHLYALFGQRLNESTMTEGYINGFIDYWFCHQGQYYVLDYKSNKLGEEMADYHPNAMQQAMDEHDYELQALIYTLALCKHLNICHQTDYETRIGGYFYLFIRGMNAHKDTPQQGIFHHKISWQQLSPLLEQREEIQ